MRANSKRRSRRGIKLVRHDPTRNLRNPERVMSSFVDCLKEGDFESAQEILGASLMLMNKAYLARKYNLPRRTAYNLMTRKSLPSLDLVAKVCFVIQQEAKLRQSK